MKDIVPELYEKIKDSFETSISSDTKLAKLLDKLKKGKATQEDANKYAERLGNAASDALLEHMTADNLPDGRIYWNIAERTIKPALETNYNMVNAYAKQVQAAIDKADGIGLKAVAGKYPADRISDIENAACMEDKTLEEARKVLGEPVRNTSIAFVDDFVEANSNFRYNAGLSPKIIRTNTGGCCKWCSNLAGVYDYEAVRHGSDVFRRHDNCRCTVIFQNGSKRQNVHTKKWEDTADTRIQPKSRILKQQEFDTARRIAKAKGEPYDATKEWLYNAKPNTGKVTTEDGYIKSKHKDEITTAQWLIRTFGGDIELLKEANTENIKTADYKWKGKLWELKNITTDNAPDGAIRRGIKQIRENKGGLILDIGDRQFDLKDIEATITDRMLRYPDVNIPIILIKKNKLIKVIEY